MQNLIPKSMSTESLNFYVKFYIKFEHSVRFWILRRVEFCFNCVFREWVCAKYVMGFSKRFFVFISLNRINAVRERRSWKLAETATDATSHHWWRYYWRRNQLVEDSALQNVGPSLIFDCIQIPFLNLVDILNFLISIVFHFFRPFLLARRNMRSLLHSELLCSETVCWNFIRLKYTKYIESVWGNTCLHSIEQWLVQVCWSERNIIQPAAINFSTWFIWIIECRSATRIRKTIGE